MNYIKMVEEFHQTFKAPVLEFPQIPPEDRCILRYNLIQEELNELKEALENKDIVEAADACTDLMVVLCGTILELGLESKFNKLFDEVHRSNMSKACLSEDDAISTVEHYKQKDGTDSYYKEINGKWIVYRTEDNKVLKSVNYSPASLKDLL